MRWDDTHKTNHGGDSGYNIHFILLKSQHCLGFLLGVHLDMINTISNNL